MYIEAHRITLFCKILAEDEFAFYQAWFSEQLIRPYVIMAE
jgi:hypothetical protein